MKLGVVKIGLAYTVDLDNPDMVEHAKECVYEDIMNAVKYNELGGWIKTAEAPDAKESDIPDFLLEDDDIFETEED